MKDELGSRDKRSEWRSNWKMVIAATSGMSLASLSTSSFGVMIAPIQQDLQWSRTEIASGPTIITLVSFSLATLFGGAVDRLGARRIGMFAVAMVCGALALMSQIGANLPAWWAVWGLVGLGSSVMPTVWLKPISSSFQAGRGLALAIVLCGSGLSSFIVPSLTNWLVSLNGWRMAYLWLALIWFAVVFPLVALFHEESASHPLQSGVSSEGTVPETQPGLTVGEGFRSRAFHILLLGALSSTFLGTALSLNIVPILRSTGLSGTIAAAIAGLMGFSIFGRLINGWLLDRSKAGLVAGSAVLVMASMPALILLFPGLVGATIGGVLIYGLAGGALVPSMAYLTGRHLGARNFGAFFGTINAIYSLGVGLGPLLANYLYDMTGSYQAIMIASIPLFGLGAILFASLDRYPAFINPRQERRLMRS